MNIMEDAFIGNELDVKQYRDSFSSYLSLLKNL